MALSAHPIRRGIILALLLAALLLLIPSFSQGVPGFSTGQASATNMCKRFGNARPGTVPARKAEKSVLCFLNRRRKAHGLRRLDGRDKLFRASGHHSDYMVDHHCFDHQCSGEASLDGRLRSVGYLTGGMLSWSYGENIAWGERRRATPRKIVRAWMHSPPHRANILNRGFKDIGIGIEWGTPQSKKANGGTYTTDFGYRLLG